MALERERVAIRRSRSSTLLWRPRPEALEAGRLGHLGRSRAVVSDRCVLQRHKRLTTDALGKLPAGAVARLLLQWAGIPIEIPKGFRGLTARQTGVGQPDWKGPDVLFNIRDGLVHPPKRLDEPYWPTCRPGPQHVHIIVYQAALPLPADRGP